MIVHNEANYERYLLLSILPAPDAPDSTHVYFDTSLQLQGSQTKQFPDAIPQSGETIHKATALAMSDAKTSTSKDFWFGASETLHVTLLAEGGIEITTEDEPNPPPAADE